MLRGKFKKIKTRYEWVDRWDCSRLVFCICRLYDQDGHDVVMMEVDVKEVEIYCYRIEEVLNV